MLAFAAGISLSASTRKHGHELELDVTLLQDSVLELGPYLYERGHVEGRE